MVQAEINKELIATVSGEIKVFNYNVDTREYIASSVEYLEVGVGIPANSCIDSPGDSKAGFAICRTSDFIAWEYVIDHRGETVFSIETGEEVFISLPGDYPKNTTTLPPVTQYDNWNGSAWVTDTDAKHAADVEAAEQEKTALLLEAQATIGLWQTELQLGVINDEDKDSLIAWVNYIKTVQVIDTSKAPDIVWPPKPDIL